MSPVQVMLVDDNDTYRARLRKLLERDPDVHVVAETGDGERAVALAAAHEPDVAIVDLLMPGIDGHETANRLRASCSGLAVLMLSTRDSAVDAPTATGPGAHAHLSKADPVGAVLVAIKAHARAGMDGGTPEPAH